MSRSINAGILTIVAAIATLMLLARGSTDPAVAEPAAGSSTTWTHLSTENGDLPLPTGSTEQTASLVLDIDKDGLDDFVIGARKSPGPSLVWYRSTGTGWEHFVIDNDVLSIEAGGAFFDIDNDNDLDLVFGGDFQSDQIWWWENPYPTYEPATPWTRRLIKDGGDNIHHDQIFGDFDNDQEVELVTWNQASWGTGTKKLLMLEIPADPKTAGTWTISEIGTWTNSEPPEGLAKADIDGDGLVDIIGGGSWFKYDGSSFSENPIAPSHRSSRAAVGQLKAGGAPEVVFVAGDHSGPLQWFEFDGATWVGHDLLPTNVDHGHSLQVADIDGNGTEDIFVAEMRLDGGNADASAWLFYGDGAGNFTTELLATGIGNHESRVADLNGDGHLDILGKPYNWQTPRLDIWLNNGSCELDLDSWQRHVVDDNRPERAVFVFSGDLDGDDLPDIASGAWWYRNPGTAAGSWQRNSFGAPLNNVAALADYDGDGSLDALGTEGIGATANADFVWAQNDGSGTFTIHDNIQPATGDFLQGVAAAPFNGSGSEVALSWHDSSVGVQALSVPADPVNEQWPWRLLVTDGQGEGLTADDIDRDGRIDLLLGTKWLQNLEAELNWADSERAYRLPVTVGANGYARSGKVAELAVDFTSHLSTLGENGALDLDSLRVVETDNAGLVINDAVPFQFDPDAGFDAAANASGTVLWLLEGATGASSERYFDIYFDVTANQPFTPVAVSALVSVSDGVQHAGFESFQIQNNNSTLYYHKEGGGFASLFDNDGNDWISYSSTPEAAGDFRGIPNLVHPNDGGLFHPGRTGLNISSSLISQGPLKTTFRSATGDGAWELQWDVYPDHARLTVLKRDSAVNYWFLYEGTPGGQLDTGSDLVTRSDGTQTLASQAWSGDIAGDEWVFFTDPNLSTPRSLYFVHHETDNIVDSYREMDSAMTVFGFGRDNNARLLTETPAMFTFGLTDETSTSNVGAVVEGAYRPLAIAASGPQAQSDTGSGWVEHTLYQTNEDPDRNRLADINGDGRLDAIVGYETDNTPGKLAWYEQPQDATAPWTEHVISSTTIAPMSLDVADVDGDGDWDVVAGEHYYNDEANSRLIVFENGGSGGSWTEHLVYTGDEHHDGAQLADMDADGDLDIVSIGWRHDRVLWYENDSCPAADPPAEPTTPPTATDPAAATATPTSSAGNGRITNGLLALYDFNEGVDAGTVYDVSGVDTPLNLTIAGSNTAWLSGGGLAVNGNTTISSAGPASKIIDGAASSNTLSVEAWIDPANLTQDGPARIVSISDSATTRNVTLGQGLWGSKPSDVFDSRLRTSSNSTDDNGEPSLTTNSGAAQDRLQHVVMTYASNGQRTVYVDGDPVASDAPGGGLGNWDSTYPLLLGNEGTGDRPWLGIYYLVAFYNRALSEQEVQQNFDAGPAPSNSSPTPTDTPAPGPTDTATVQPTATATTEQTATATTQPTATATDTPSPSVTPEQNATPVGGNDVFYLSAASAGTIGSLNFNDEDILRYDAGSGSYTLFFDGSDVGLASSDIDAFHLLSDGSLVFSTTNDVSLPGVGDVDDSDLLRFIPTSTGDNTDGSFSLLFDGSDVGLTDNAEDIDAVTLLADGTLLISTLGSYNVASVSGADEDLLLFEPTTWGSETSGTWSLYLDGGDVGLAGSIDKDIWAVWADTNGSDIYFSTRGVFDAQDQSGDGADIVVCQAPVTGGNSSCSLNSYWDGSAHGFADLSINALHVARDESSSGPPASPTNTPTATNTPPPADTSTPTPTSIPGSGTTILYFSISNGGTAGGVSFGDEDILRYDTGTGTYTLHFDGSDVGLVTSDVDAFHLLDDGSILLSFDGSASLPNVGTVADADLVRFVPTSLGSNTSGAFELYFDGSDVELTENAEDIDALVVLPDGSLLLSTKGGWAVSSLNGNDEDLIRFTPGSLGSNTSGTWSLYFDGSDVNLSDGNDEDLWAAWSASSGADLYLSLRDLYAVNGLSGDGADVLTCDAFSNGAGTNCNFSLFWDGTAHDLDGLLIDGLHVSPGDSGAVSPTPTNTAVPSATNTSTPLPSPTNTAVPNATNTPTPLASATNTAVPTATNTATPLPTATDTPTATSEPPTATPIPDGDGRVSAGLLALYDFVEGNNSGLVYDVSGAGVPLNLTIENGSTSWLAGGGLAITGNSQISSAGAASKIIDNARAANALTVEAWVKPANLTQDGPARIVSISNSATTRNFTLGQGLWGNSPSDLYDIRLRTSDAGIDENGQPSLSTASGSAKRSLQHLVVTFANGQRTVYLDGSPVLNDSPGGNLSNWDSSFPLLLTNEATGDRPWLGELHLIAFYDRALTAGDISQNFAAGVNGQTPPAPTPTPDSPAPTATNTPVPPTATPGSGGGGNGAELLIFDWNRPVTESHRGFPNDTPPLAEANGDWTQPINYAEGTLHFRVEIRSQPVAQNMRLQLCFWQEKNGDRFGREACGRLQNVVGTSGNVVTWEVPVQDIWNKPNSPILWDRPRYRYGVAIKNEDGLPVSNFQGWDWNGENPKQWYPLDMRFTAYVVEKGKTFSGWDSYN